jgi:hypothetical protein
MYLQKEISKKIIFGWRGVFKVTYEKSRILIRTKMSRTGTLVSSL